MVNENISDDYEYGTFGINCRCYYFYPNHPTRSYYRFLYRWKWAFLVAALLLCHLYWNQIQYDSTRTQKGHSNHTVKRHEIEFYGPINKTDDCKYYNYPLVNSTEINMCCGTTYSYKWFMSHIRSFKNLGENETRKYAKDAPVCQSSLSFLKLCRLKTGRVADRIHEMNLFKYLLQGAINVSKEVRDLRTVEQQHPAVMLGGYYAPAHCRPRYRVAILVPYRNRQANLAIFLYYIHSLLRKQLLEYRIFVIEQYGSEEFNKGALYNVGFIESQRFGTWQCVIFHDVDLVPQDERILYSCPRKPTHMSTSVESQNYRLPYLKLFGGVTALTVKQFEAVNGYSNLYLNWGGEDDDMYKRVQAKRYPILRYSRSIARYVALPHDRNVEGRYRYTILYFAKRRFRKEGLNSIRYRLIKVTKTRLYTHILVNVNPFHLKITNDKMWREYIFSFDTSK